MIEQNNTLIAQNERIIAALERGMTAQVTTVTKPTRSRSDVKLQAAIEYLKHNPQAVAVSSRQLAETVTDINVSHNVWAQAKRNIK